MLGFVAESAEFSQGKFIFHGIRVDFAPSETPHISLLKETELEDPLQEVSVPISNPQVQILEESTEVDEKREEFEEEKTYEDGDEDDGDEEKDVCDEDDGGLMPMDLSE